MRSTNNYANVYIVYTYSKRDLTKYYVYSILYYNGGKSDFFFVLCVYFGFLSNHIVFFSIKTVILRGCCHWQSVNSNHPSFFQLVTMLDLHFDRQRTFIFFSHYSGKYFMDKNTEHSNTRSFHFVFRCIKLLFFHV